MKTLKNFFQKDAVRLSTAGLLCFFAAYLSFPVNGLAATFCPIVLTGLLIPFFYDEARFVVPICALSLGLLSPALLDTGWEKIFYTAVLSLLFFGAIQITRLFRRSKGHRTLLICSIVGIFFLFGVHLVLFGNPISLIQKQHEAKTHYETVYADLDFQKTESYYAPLKRKYLFGFDTGKHTFTSPAGEDGYLAFLKEHAAAKQKSELLTLLHDNFSDGNYHVSIQTGTAPVASPCPYSYGDAPDEWRRENEIVLEFDASISIGTPDAKASFASRVRRYVTAINEAGFLYKKVTFRAGEQGKMVYELVAMPDTELTELVAPNVTDLSS